MRPVGVAGTGSYLPPKVVTNFDLEKMVDTTDEWIVTKTGIRERRVVEDGVCTSDLGVEAAERALEDAGMDAEDVDLIVLATSSPDVVLPSTACIIQGKLGAVNAAAFDVMGVCAGFVYALDVGSKYVADGTCDNALIIGAEAYSRIINWRDRTTCVFFGDGAGACVLGETEEGKGVLASYLRADGAGRRVIQVPAGGSEMPVTHELIDRALQYFHMDGRAVWNFAIRAVPDAVRQVLRRCRLRVEDVDLLVAHQSNINIIKAGMEALGLPMEKTYTNLDRYGNTAAASIPIALDEARRKGKVEDGDLVVLAGYGAGLAWGANAVRWWRDQP